MGQYKILIPEEIKKIILALEAAGYEAYVVGGCVRDSFLCGAPNDWDVCTSALPEEVKGALSDFKIVDTGIEHGTVTAIYDGNPCEITTFRSESNYSDHRHPDSVDFSKDISSDLKRRDFTVNAMAYSPKSGLVDLYNGQEDLKNKILRCVGNPRERFNEDALRILRALRFSACLGFEIEEETEKAILEQFPLLSYVASERIFGELKRLVCGHFATRVTSKFKTVFDFIFSTKISTLCKTSEKFSLQIARLLRNLSEIECYNTLKRMKFDNATIKEVMLLKSFTGKDTEFNAYNIKLLLSRYGREKTLLIYQFLSENESDNILRLIENLPEITVSNLAIDGNDLIAAGVEPGKRIRELLSLSLELVINEECENSKEALIKRIL